ncbi:MAG: Unknown protein [uncultured Sulfurovum sp.]|uniref:Uncharacterized protein n=1 Tax=uncultured Sulfurovum sp. TaxID=269237 RepID=A0A6S6SWC3_9BACT|nr:MAG: Unknown protein [uncultured Sulfurovum sp.]
MLHEQFSASFRILANSKKIKKKHSQDILGDEAYGLYSEHLHSVKIDSVINTITVESITLASLAHGRTLYMNKVGEEYIVKKYILRELYYYYPHLIDYFWRTASISRLLFIEIRKAELAKASEYKDFDFIDRMPIVFHLPIAYTKLFKKLISKSSTYFKKLGVTRLKRGASSLFRYVDLSYEYAAYLNDISNKNVSFENIGKYFNLIKHKYFEIVDLLVDNDDLYYLLDHMSISKEFSFFIDDKFPLLEKEGSLSSEFRDKFNGIIQTSWHSTAHIFEDKDEVIEKKAYWFCDQSHSLKERGGVPTHITASDFYLHFISQEDRHASHVDMFNRIYFFIKNRNTYLKPMDDILKNEFVEKQLLEYSSTEKEHTYNIVSSTITTKNMLEEAMKKPITTISNKLGEQVQEDIKNGEYLHINDTERTLILLNTIHTIIFEHKYLFPKTKIVFYAKIRDKILRNEILNMFKKEIKTINRANNV